MININVQIEVLTVGDGGNHTDTYGWTNPNGVPPTTVSFTASESEQLITVNVPPTAKGMVIITAATGSTKKIRGVNGDAGAVLTGMNYVAFKFPEGNPPASIVLSSTTTEVWTIIWA